MGQDGQSPCQLDPPPIAPPRLPSHTSDGQVCDAQMSVSRSLTRTIWVNIGLASPTRGPGGPLNLPTEQAPTLSSDTQEGKAKAVRLVVAFLVATKHHIRREYGIKYHGADARVPRPLCALRGPRMA